jgi:FlaG/FlaF family flagellin (archaellin)
VSLVIGIILTVAITDFLAPVTEEFVLGALSDRSSDTHSI